MSDNVAERLTRLETIMEHVATREDIEKAKNSILRWFMVMLVAAVGAIAGVVASL